MCDAKTLYEAMESRVFVDWKSVISLMSERNTGQFKAILSSYKELYGQEFLSNNRVSVERFQRDIFSLKQSRYIDTITS